MSEADEARRAEESPPGLEDYERLETELRKAVERLGAEELPLERRLALHGQAVRLQGQAEELLRTARRETEAVEQAAEEDAAPDEQAADAPGAEETAPYEALQKRLEEVVRRLEESGDDLPLEEVVRLHAEAHGLAARCDAILKAAQGRIETLESGREDAEDGDAPADGDDSARS